MDDEKYGTRSLAYSAWHRRASTARFIPDESARLLAQIDLDHVLWIEYNDETKEPIVLIEEAQDVGQSNKPSTVTRNLARLARLPALLVLWKPSDIPNPAGEDWPDIEHFRVKRIWPPDDQDGWKGYTPKQYAETLLRLRTWQYNKLDDSF